MIFFYFAEIRYRLGYLFCSFLITFYACYFYSLPLIYLFARPFLHSKHNVSVFLSMRDTMDTSKGYDTREGHDTIQGFIFTNLTEAFHTTLKICFIWSLVFVIPVIFYQFWSFFAPSWHSFERARRKKHLVSGILLNVFAGLCSYFLILPLFLDFLLNFKVDNPLFTIQLEARIDSYVKISSVVFLIVQFLFQTPLFFSFLYASGYIHSVFLSLNRKVFVLFFLLLSALLAPPDPLTQCFLFLLFWLLFEFLIWIGFLQWKKKE